MDRMIFLNLPVADLGASMAFYTGLGFRTDERFTSDECACIVISDTIFVMAMTRQPFADFVPGRIGDPAEATTVIN